MCVWWGGGGLFFPPPTEAPPLAVSNASRRALFLAVGGWGPGRGVRLRAGRWGRARDTHAVDSVHSAASSALCDELDPRSVSDSTVLIARAAVTGGADGRPDPLAVLVRETPPLFRSLVLRVMDSAKNLWRVQGE